MPRKSNKHRHVQPGKPPVFAWLRRRLLAWFALHQRPLPWRKNRDPYLIWVSEIMLQQTQVATVIPYFNRFVKVFPRVRALAQADEHQVLRLWEGLGYYRRARDLHRAARQLLAEHDGQFPRDPAVLRGFPGFGRYTVGAVLSQAFDCRLPIVETNSMRMLCRCFGLKGNPRSGPMRKKVWRLAEDILPSRRVGEFNQALMELGALVCTPLAPRCDDCPLAKHCRARQLGIQEMIPLRPPRATIEEIEEVAIVVYRGTKVLLVQRAAGGRWANMWEFPHISVEQGRSAASVGKRWLVRSAGIQAIIGKEILTLRHSVTRFRITMVCLLAKYCAGTFRSQVYQQGKWVDLEELVNFPVSSPQRRLAHAVLGEPEACPRVYFGVFALHGRLRFRLAKRRKHMVTRTAPIAILRPLSPDRRPNPCEPFAVYWCWLPCRAAANGTFAHGTHLHLLSMA